MIDQGPIDTWEVGLCELTYPPKFRGTVNPIMFIGDTNALIYCKLIGKRKNIQRRRTTSRKGPKRTWTEQEDNVEPLKSKMEKE